MKPSNKPLVIFGSPRKAGNTRELLNAWLAREAIPAYDEFDCYAARPEPCLACNYCQSHYGCAQKDLEAFWPLLLECNRLILAAPVYFNGLPGPVKNLLDRFQRFYGARFSLGMRPTIPTPKKATVLLTSGSDTPDPAVILAGVKQAFSVMNTTLCETVFLPNTDQTPVRERIGRVC